MELSALLASAIALVLGFSIWAILNKVGALKTTNQNLTDQFTDRALKSTSAGLDTLERVIDSLEKRIAQQEKDYIEDLDRLRSRHKADTKLLKDEVVSLRQLLVIRTSKLAQYEEILKDNNLMPDE